MLSVKWNKLITWVRITSDKTSLSLHINNNPSRSHEVEFIIFKNPEPWPPLQTFSSTKLSKSVYPAPAAQAF